MPNAKKKQNDKYSGIISNKNIKRGGKAVYEKRKEKKQ